MMRSRTSYGGSVSWSVWLAASSADGARTMVDSRDGALPRAERVAVLAEPVDQGLGNVLEHGEAARHVAVERGVADRRLALVAGGEHQPAELVGERHQQVAADAGLDVLLGDARRRRIEVGGQLLEVASRTPTRSVSRRSARPGARRSRARRSWCRCSSSVTASTRCSPGRLRARRRRCRP